MRDVAVRLNGVRRVEVDKTVLTGMLVIVAIFRYGPASNDATPCASLLLWLLAFRQCLSR